MEGLMQDWPLLVHTVLDHASTYHGDQEIVSRTVEGPIHRYTYKDLNARSKQLASVAGKLGIKHGDVVGTMAWNGYRHMEVWYGLMGIGAIAHTLNPRLFADQLDYIINHAEDKVFFLDLTFVPILEAIQDKLPTIETFVIMTDEEHMPETSLRNATCYETLIADGRCRLHLAEARRKHRLRHVLHVGHHGQPERCCLFAPVQRAARAVHLRRRCGRAQEHRRDHAGGAHVPRQRLVVRLFLAHVRRQDGDARTADGRRQHLRAAGNRKGHSHRSRAHGVADAAAAPRRNQSPLPHLKRVIIGGSACPPAMIEAFEKNYDTQVIHAWGMTEMSPLGTLCNLKGRT